MYGVLVAAIALTRFDQPGVPAVALAHLAVPFLAWLAVHAPPTRLGRALRAGYPIVLLIGLYSAIDVLNGFGAAATWDPQAQAIDQALFGMQPSRDWWRAHPSAFWSTVMHSAYLSYYIAVPLPIAVFLFRRRSDRVERYLNGVIATYIVCYLCYLVVPVAGPYYEFAKPGGAFVANWPARVVYSILGGGSAYGAAFPSSHVAAVVAASIGAWRGSRWLGAMLAVPAAFLTVGVVYCQMHYAVDSVAGLLTAVIVGGLLMRERNRMA